VADAHEHRRPPCPARLPALARRRRIEVPRHRRHRGGVDWASPLHRDAHELATIATLGAFQRFCEGFGVDPVYLVNHTIATSPETAAVLGPPIAAGRGCSSASH